MEIKRGDIYYISKMYSITSGTSIQSPGRPGIVVSNDANNKHSDIVEVVYLTTQPKKDLPTHCPIRSTAKVSTALCEQITTISVDLINDYIATCTDEEMRAVDACLAISIGLTTAAPQPKPVEEPEKPALQDAVIDELYCEIDDKDAEIALREGRISTLEEMIDELTAELTRRKAREELLRELYDSLITKS